MDRTARQGDRPPAFSRRQFLRTGAILGGTMAFGALLAACGNSGTATTGTSGGAAGGGAAGASTAPGPITREAAITLWNFGVEETNPFAKARVDAFTQKYPNFKLDIVPKADDQKILTGAASKQLPDILWLGREALSSWAARGVLNPIDDLIAKNRFDMGQFYESAVAEVKYDNKTWGVPQFMTVRVLYVNTDALGEAGLDPSKLDTGNWEQLNDLGVKLTKRVGDRFERWGFDNKVDSEFHWLWGMANGGKFISDDGKKVSFNDPKIVEAVDWAAKNYEAQGGYQGYKGFATTFQNDEQFARGLVAMTLYENWMMGIIARTVPERNFVVVPMKMRGGSETISFTTGNAWTIPTGAKDREAAFEFIRFMSAEDTFVIGANAVKEANKKNGRPYVPTLTGHKAGDQAQISKVYEPIQPKFDDAVKLFPKVLETARKIPTSISPVSKQINDLLKNEAIKPALSGERPAKDGLDRANQKAQQEIDAFQPS
jgi:multiple sugar transport system substrate-binding protein